MTEMPKFEGREIVPRANPKRISAEILGGEFGRVVDQEVQERYGEFNTINKIGYNSFSKVVKGSNVYYVTAVNEVIRENGLRTMTYDDSKQIKNSDSLNLFENYEDIAVVARGLRGINDYHAKKFLKGISDNLPVTVNLSDCVLKKDDKSEHGLVILPGDNPKIISGDVADYKGNAAISRLSLGGNLGLGSNWGDLADSDSDGRVVVVKE